MSHASTEQSQAAAGETPETLNSLQILLAHLLIGGIALFFVGLGFPGSSVPRISMLVLTIGSLVLAAPKILGFIRLRPQELTVLAAILTLASAFLAICFAPA